MIAIVVSAAVAGGIAWIVGNQGTPGQQLDHLRGTLDEEGLEITSLRMVSLHAGARSYLMTVGERGVFEPSEIRIYDATPGALSRRFSFHPKVESGVRNTKLLPLEFSTLAVEDFDGDGQKEVLGSYDAVTPFGTARLPLAIAWDAQSGSYRIAPLLSAPPNPAPGLTPFQRSTLAPFEKPYVVSTSTSSFQAWAAAALVVLQRPLIGGTGSYLGAAFPSKDEHLGESLAHSRLQLAFWAIVNPPGRVTPRLFRLCWGWDSDRVLEAEIKGSEDQEDLIRQTWARLVQGDERARRGEVPVDSAVYVGAADGTGCMFGE